MDFTIMSYKITSRDYLERAKQCVDSNDIEFLFYAALEIRCGVEARMQEYLEVQNHISKRKKQGWQVAKLAKNIESTFKIGEKEAILEIYDIGKNNILFEARYTPVKKSLRKKAQQLGDYLHNAKKYHKPGSEYWVKFQKLLNAAVSELEYANSGRLLGPLLMHPNKKNIDMKLEIPTTEEQETAVKFFQNKSNIIAKVRYE